MMWLTLLIGSLGGAIAFSLSLPIPWLVGSLVAVCAAQSFGLSLNRPDKRLERLMRVLIGVVLGASIVSSFSDISLLLLITILVAIIFTTLVTAFGTLYFLRLPDFKKLDSFLSSLPGGLSFLIALSGDLGKRFPKIALIHTIRVIVLVFTFSVLALLLNADQPEQSIKQSFHFGVDSLSWRLLVLVLVCGVIAEKSKIAGSHVLFSLILSALAYQMQWVTTPMPELVTTIAMIVFGSLLGYELSLKPDRSYIKVISNSVVFTLVVMVAALVISLSMAAVVNEYYLLFLLALAPGGIAEISLIALALGFDAGFVAAVHACRFGFIMLMGPLGLNLAMRKENNDS